MPLLGKKNISKKTGCWVYDIEANTFYCSDEIPEILPCSKDHSKKDLQTLLSLLRENGIEQWLEDYQKCLVNGGTYQCRFEIDYFGIKKWVGAQISGNFGINDSIGVMLGTFQDISEEMGTEQKLISTQNLLKTILDFMPGPVYSKAPDGTYLYVNKKYLESVNMKIQDPIGKNDFNIFSNEIAKNLRENDEHVMSSKLVQEIVEKVPHPDGSTRVYESYKFPTFDQFGTVQTLTGISFDITEKLVIKKKLELERSRLIQASKMTALGEMAGGIAHEINNPLAIIQGYTIRLKSLFFKSESDESNRALELTDEILKAVERTGAIIGGFKKFARKPINEKFKKISVEKIIQETVALCRARFSESSVDLILEVESGLEVDCQEIHISQIILNLLGNALDATNGSREAKKEVLIKAFSDEVNGIRVARVQVQDWGMGFSEEAQINFMEPFFSTKEEGKGTGLGLSISKSLVEKHNGVLKLVSNSQPTNLEIMLPVNYKKKDLKFEE